MITHTARRRRNAGGFTLIELLLVLVILGTLAAIVVPKFTGRGEQAKEAAARATMKSIELALDAFEIDNGSYPQGTDGLASLIEEPNDAKDWKGPYLKLQDELPVDPWGNLYVYEYPGKHNTRGYDLMSVGVDGRPDTEDDIVNWSTSR